MTVSPTASQAGEHALRERLLQASLHRHQGRLDALDHTVRGVQHDIDLGVLHCHCLLCTVLHQLRPDTNTVTTGDTPAAKEGRWWEETALDRTCTVALAAAPPPPPPDAPSSVTSNVRSAYPAHSNASASPAAACETHDDDRSQALQWQLVGGIAF